MTLDEIAIKYGTDKGSKHPSIEGHDYCRHYEKFFEPFREDPIRMVEIGVAGGNSIQTWLEYFPKALVLGVDKNKECAVIKDERHKVIYGDQCDPTFWECFKSDYGTDFDLMIDDGDHDHQPISQSFKSMWPAIKRGGLYCIEDVHVFYNSLCSSGGRDYLATLSAGIHHTAWPEHMQMPGLLKDIDLIYQAKGLVILKKVA
jgi:demethylmacrocin O-methyltransferase